MIELDIPLDIIGKARKLSDELGVLKHSLTKGKGNLYGFIGELLFNSIVKGKLDNTYDYDIVMKDGSKIDVKAKKTTVKPLPYYVCTVPAYNIKQKCDYYGFVRVMDDLSKAWVLGLMPKEKFFKEATFMDKGERNGSYINKMACYNVKIEDLDEIPK